METIEDQERKQTDAITNQKKRLAALTNKDDENLSHKEIFEELVRERFDEIRELTNEANLDGLIYYLKGNTARKIFDDFDNRIKHFGKIKSDDAKLQKAKNSNIFLNQI